MVYLVYVYGLSYFILFIDIYFFWFCAPNGLFEMFGIAYQSKTWKSTRSIFNMEYCLCYIIME